MNFYREFFLVLLFFTLPSICVGTEYTYSVGVSNKLTKGSDKKQIIDLFTDSEISTRLIYLDTRDPERFIDSKKFIYELIEKFAKSLKEKGEIFMVAENNLEHSKDLFNYIFKDFEFSYYDGPFLVGYSQSETKHTSEVLLDLSGLSEKCIINYIQDIERAIFLDEIDNKAIKKWKINSLPCELSGIAPDEYSEKIESIWKFLKWFTNDFSYTPISSRAST